MLFMELFEVSTQTIKIVFFINYRQYKIYIYAVRYLGEYEDKPID